MLNKENGKNMSDDSMFEFESFEYEKSHADIDINASTEAPEHRPSRRRGKHGSVSDFSAFGAPMKAQNGPTADKKADSENAQVTENSAPDFAEKAEISHEFDVQEVTEPEAEALKDIQSLEAGEVSEDSEISEKKETELSETAENTAPTTEEPENTDFGYGQIRGFGLEQYGEDESEKIQEAAEANEELLSEENTEVSESCGIQQKFDITFLEPMSEEKEKSEPEKNNDALDVVMSEVVEATYSGDVEYETEDTELENESVVVEEESIAVEESSKEMPSELEAVTELTDGFDDSTEKELKETEAPKTDDVDAPEINDVWDEEGREEWKARERFLEHCRSLSIPPLKTTKTEKPTKRRQPMRSTTSGYQYESAERLPIDEGTKTIENESEYRKKEKLFCKKRAREYEEKLREKLSKAKAKFWTVAVFLVLSLALDCMNFVSFGGKSVINPKTFIAFECAEAVLLVIVAVLSLGILRDGISCAFKGDHIPETLTAMVMFVSLAYNGLALIIEHGENIPVIMGAPAVASVLLAMLYRYKMLCRELKTFSVASAYRPYTTGVKMKDFPSAPEYTEFGGYAPSESELYKLNKIYRIDGIYETQPVRDTCFGFIRILCLVTLCVSFVVGLAFGLIEKSISGGVFSAVLVMALASPVSVFVSMYLPRIKATKANEQDGSAIISFKEADSTFEKNVIMLDDSELYPAQSLSPKIEVCKTPDMEERLHKVASLFNRLGGTLGSLFDEAGFEDYKEVELREIEAHGIYATVDGSDVVVGSEKYLSSYGIKVNRYEGILSPDSGVLYIADGGQFFCRIIMTFKPDTELCRRISELRNADTLVSLKSCNPCIDEALVFTTTALEPELLKLIKYSSGDDVCPAETDREGNIVSLNGSAGLFSALLEYKRQKRRIFIGSRHAVFSCIIGTAVAVGLVIGGASVLKAAPIIAVGIQAILSVIAGFAVSGRAIDTRTVIKKK